MTIQEAKTKAVKALSTSPSPQLDAEVFLQHIMEKDKTWLLFNRDAELSEEQEKTFLSYVESRTTGLPVAYITGHKEFYGHDFLVTPDVLIPKPDTELLVEKSVEILERKFLAKPGTILTVCDMCTGSGCVGISIMNALYENGLIPLDRFPSMLLADISDKALNIARQNINHAAIPQIRDRIKLVRTNLFQMIGETFDLIASNPPYIPGKEARELLKDGRSEPLLALDGDITLEGFPTGENDGLGIIRNLVPQAQDHLSPEGELIVETGEYNAEMTAYIFEHNNLENVKIYKDLEGQLRDVHGKLAQYHSHRCFL